MSWKLNEGQYCAHFRFWKNQRIHSQATKTRIMYCLQISSHMQWSLSENAGTDLLRREGQFLRLSGVFGCYDRPVPPDSATREKFQYTFKMTWVTRKTRLNFLHSGKDNLLFLICLLPKTDTVRSIFAAHSVCILFLYWFPIWLLRRTAQNYMSFLKRAFRSSTFVSFGLPGRQASA